ncbi:MAG TPA: glycosyltransferase, partial [bacterium]|nr:glycosyltransferase [bacterium]
MKFSVVIPNHNGSATLPEALEGLFAAGARSGEVIVADDASTDGSDSLAERFPVKVERSSVNRGAASARNLGARSASGDILVFVDNDVVVPPDVFSCLEEDFADPSVAGVIGLLAPVTRFPDLCSQYKNYYMHYTYMKLPRRVGVFYTSLAAVRREVFAEVGGFDEQYRSATIEDLEIGLRIVKRGRPLVIDKRLQVDHIRHYGFSSLCRTAFRRAAGSAKIALRDRISSRKSSYVTTSRAFLGGMVLTFAAAAALLAAAGWRSWEPAAAAAVFAAAAVAINAGFLA